MSRLASDTHSWVPAGKNPITRKPLLECAACGKQTTVPGRYGVQIDCPKQGQGPTDLIAWCREQQAKGRIVVALVSPEQDHAGPRYAGYYCEEAPGTS